MHALSVGDGGAFVAGRSRLANCRFDIFDANDIEKTWKNLVDAQAPKHFSPDPYHMLEGYYRGKGLRHLADEVYYAGRQADRVLILPGSPRKRLLDNLSWALTGYGVRLRRLGLGIAAFLIAGTCIFWPDDALAPAKQETTTAAQTKALPAKPVPAIQAWLPAPVAKGFRRFGYSLGTFLPLVDLRLAKDWEPVGDWRRAYLALHIAVGWILIPLLVAGITAQLNKN
jgi:hypothetical protein